MPQLTAALLALAALSGSILAGHEPLRSLASGAIAGAVGWIAGGLWQGLTGFLLGPKQIEAEPQDQESAEAKEDTEKGEVKERKAA